MFTEEQKAKQASLIQKVRKRKGRFTDRERKQQEELLLKVKINKLILDTTYGDKPGRSGGNHGNGPKTHPETLEAMAFVRHFLRQNPGQGPKAVGEARGFEGKRALVWGERILRKMSGRDEVVRTGFGKWVVKEDGN